MLIPNGLDFKRRPTPARIVRSSFFAVVLMFSGWLPVAHGQADSAGFHQQDARGANLATPTLRESANVNEHTHGLAFAANSPFAQVVDDLGNELAFHGGVRLVASMAPNQLQGAYDLLYLRGIDLAIMQSDVIEYIERQGDVPDIRSVVNSLGQIGTGKVILMARDGIDSVQQLAGKRVGIGPPGSEAGITGELLFDALGIDMDAVSQGPIRSLRQLLEGELDALLVIDNGLHAALPGSTTRGHRLSDLLSKLEPQDGLKLLELQADGELAERYQLATLTAAEFPGLLGPDQSSLTVSVPIVMAVYRWALDSSRGTRLALLVEALLQSRNHLQTGVYEDYWSDFDIESDIPGMTRLALIDQLIDERQAQEEAIVDEARDEVLAAEQADRERLVRTLERRRADVIRLIEERTIDPESTRGAELQTLFDELDAFVKDLEEGQ